MFDYGGTNTLSGHSARWSSRPLEIRSIRVWTAEIFPPRCCEPENETSVGAYYRALCRRHPLGRIFPCTIDTAAGWMHWLSASRNRLAGASNVVALCLVFPYRLGGDVDEFRRDLAA